MKKICFYFTLCILIFSFTIYAKKRKVLVEVFTSTTCPPCAYWNPQFDKWLFSYQHSNYVGVIKYHVWWPAKGDPYYDSNVEENKNRVSYYGVRSVPSNFIDGVSGKDYMTHISNRLEESSPFEILITGNITTKGGVLSVKVNTDSSPVPSDTLVLHTVIVESDLYYVGSNKDPQHEYVMRKMLPGSEGEALKMTSNDSKLLTQNIIWNSSWNLDNSKIIVFIQNKKTKEILQTEIKTLASKPVLKIAPSEMKVSYKSGMFNSEIFNEGVGKMKWKVAILEGADWIKIEPYSGTDKGNMTIHYSENIESKNRVGKIQISADSSTGSPKSIDISQAGALSANWKINSFGSDFDFFSIASFNDKVSVAVGTEKTILKTSNSGKTWDKLPTDNLNYQIFEKVACPDANTIVIGGNDFIITSTNGGKTWIEHKPQIKQSFASISFCSPKIGFAFGVGNVFLKTENGGRNWDKGDYGDNKNIRNAFCIDTKTLVALSTGGIIIKSTDAGKNWEKINTNLKVNLFGVYFTSLKNGVIVGDKGTILITTDGGKNWEQVKNSTNKRLYSVSFSDNKNGFIVGEDGLILFSSDSGKTWSEKTSGVWDQFRSVSFKSNLATIVGSKGVLLRTESKIK